MDVGYVVKLLSRINLRANPYSTTETSIQYLPYNIFHKTKNETRIYDQLQKRSGENWSRNRKSYVRKQES